MKARIAQEYLKLVSSRRLKGNDNIPCSNSISLSRRYEGVKGKKKIRKVRVTSDSSQEKKKKRQKREILSV